MKSYLPLLLLIGATKISKAQTRPVSASETKTRINFYVISRPHKIDPASYYNIARTKLKCVFKGKRFKAIVASSPKKMERQIKKALNKHDAMIGSLWFDSHGSFKKGYSFFTVGHGEFSYKNINDTDVTSSLRVIANYCASNSKIGIGSCYGGATYERPETSKLPLTRMNGDSLMMGLGEIFRGSTIYGCESWVMTKPGLFRERFAMAGAPPRKKFKDSMFKPVWERVGEWNSYNSNIQSIRQVNCVMMDKNGNIGTRFNQYQSKPRVKKQIARKLDKLEPGLLKI